ADLKALRYLTSANMVKSDRANKHPGIANMGPMFCMDPNDHRCCQHNVAQGWPYYAEHLWLATGGNGIAAVLFAESSLISIVGNGTPVTSVETTEYPFREKAKFEFKTAKPNRFPFTLRVPGWCSGEPSVSINGKKQDFKGFDGAGYITLDREWENGDTVEVI